MVEFEPVDMEEIGARPHSYRNWDPDEIARIAFQEGEYTAREWLQYIEAGRFNEMLEAIHKMYVPLDADERETFWKRNPSVMVWVHVWAILNAQLSPRAAAPDDVELPLGGMTVIEYNLDDE